MAPSPHLPSQKIKYWFLFLHYIWNATTKKPKSSINPFPADTSICVCANFYSSRLKVTGQDKNSNVNHGNPRFYPGTSPRL